MRLKIIIIIVDYNLKSVNVVKLKMRLVKYFLNTVWQVCVPNDGGSLFHSDRAERENARSPWL